MRYEVNILIA